MKCLEQWRLVSTMSLIGGPKYGEVRGWYTPANRNIFQFAVIKASTVLVQQVAWLFLVKP